MRRSETDVPAKMTLPISVEGLIPHDTPMRLVDTLLSVGEQAARTCARVTEEMPFVRGNGGLDECAYIELMAQSIAAVAGYRGLSGGAGRSGGMLVGVKDLRIEGSARVGDLLQITVYKAVRFGDVSIVEGVVERDGEVVARGEIRVWEKVEANE